MTKKIIVSVTAVILLIAVYCMIFGFSAEDGEESGARSEMVCRFCVQTINQVFSCGWTEQEIAAKTDFLQLPVRKLAHFSEYAVIAVLLFWLLIQWLPINKKMFVFIVLWVAVSASLDEMHQLYVPGRSGNLKDVFIDTLGGSTGLIISVLFRYRREKKLMS